jgi:hypothetical protein
MDKKKVTDFGSGDDYKAQIAKAKGDNVPVGGAPMPAKMPRLDQAPTGGDRFTGVQNARSSAAAAKILTPEEQAALASEGKLRAGVGSAYAANQPNVNQKDGRQMQTPQNNQEFVNPPRPEGAGLRKETVDQLIGINEAAKAEAKENGDDVPLKKAAEEIEDLTDGWITDEFGNRVRSIVNNKARREAIEKRCSPMDIADLITTGEIRQRVPIVPGVFEPTYRSTGGNEDLFVKRLLSKATGSEQYLFDLYALMNLATSLYAINNKIMPSHLHPSTGEPDEKAFEAKMAMISKMPLALLTDLSTNYVWFGRRVQKLLVIDDIKGF